MQRADGGPRTHLGPALRPYDGMKEVAVERLPMHTYTPAIEVFFTPLSWKLWYRRDADGISAGLGPVTAVLLWRFR